MISASDTIADADRILIEALADGDAAWLPQRKFDGGIGGAVYESRRISLIHGVPWRSGARSNEEEKATRQALKGLAADGFVRTAAPKRVKTLFVSLTDRGQTYTRQLCGLPDDSDAWSIASEVAVKTKPDPQVFDQLWLSERELIPANRRGMPDGRWMAVIETMSLPFLSRRLIAARCSADRNAYYALTVAGWRWLLTSDEPPATDYDGDRAARAVYDERLTKAHDRLSQSKPDGAAGREIGEIPLPVAGRGTLIGPHSAECSYGISVATDDSGENDD